MHFHLAGVCCEEDRALFFYQSLVSSELLGGRKPSVAPQWVADLHSECYDLVFHDLC